MGKTISEVKQDILETMGHASKDDAVSLAQSYLTLVNAERLEWELKREQKLFGEFNQVEEDTTLPL